MIELIVILDLVKSKYFSDTAKPDLATSMSPTLGGDVESKLSISMFEVFIIGLE